MRDIVPLLSGAAALVSILAFFRSRRSEPAHLAPGVSYEATVRVSPAINEGLAADMIEVARGTLITVEQKRSATDITYRFTAVGHSTVTPGQVLFAHAGRKAILRSIREL